MRSPAAVMAACAGVALVGVAGAAWAGVEGLYGRDDAVSQREDAPPATAVMSGQRTAAAIVARLEEAGLPVTDARRCTEPSPTSPELPASVAFRDRRITSAYPVPTVFGGGDVEVFTSPAAMRKRRAELAQQALDAHSFGFDEGGHQLHPEHQYAVGTVLMRISGDLDVEAASAYETALRAAVAAPGKPVHLEEMPCSI